MIFDNTTPLIILIFETINQKRAKRTSRQLESMYIIVGQKKLILTLSLSPIFSGVILFLLFGKPVAILLGVVLGFVLPSLVIRFLQVRRKAKFQKQLFDALTSLTQSLKAGLSFLQALEVLVEEMSPPISQEFGMVVKENKMGMPLEESFARLSKKMDLEDLDMITAAILVARETGGNLTDVFSHLSETIRSKQKLADQVKTLTIQARWQGIIMSVLPVIFAFAVYNMNPNYFQDMLESETGRLLLIWCLVSEFIGAILLNRLSRVEV